MWATKVKSRSWPVGALSPLRPLCHHGKTMLYWQDCNLRHVRVLLPSMDPCVLEPLRFRSLRVGAPGDADSSRAGSLEQYFATRCSRREEGVGVRPCRYGAGFLCSEVYYHVGKKEMAQPCFEGFTPLGLLCLVARRHVGSTHPGVLKNPPEHASQGGQTAIHGWTRGPQSRTLSQGLCLG